MDITAIVAALITGVVTVLGVVISNSRAQAIMEERIEVIRRDLGDLKAKVEKDHDLYMRMVKVEQSLGTAWRRIDEHTEDIEKLKEEKHVCK